VVGRGAKIGARATVLDDVPAGGRAIGPRAVVTGVSEDDGTSEGDQSRTLFAGG
jgi:serine acetyltransferase